MNKFYEIGERHEYPCGCVCIATEAGFDHYVNPSCPFDNKPHAAIKGYDYKPWYALPYP